MVYITLLVLDNSTRCALINQVAQEELSLVRFLMRFSRQKNTKIKSSTKLVREFVSDQERKNYLMKTRVGSTIYKTCLGPFCVLA